MDLKAKKRKAWNSGLTKSDPRISAMVATRVLTDGYKLSKDAKALISKRTKFAMANSAVRLKMKNSDSTKLKKSIAKLGDKNPSRKYPELRTAHSVFMTQFSKEHPEVLASARLKRKNSKTSSIEIAMQKLLDKLGIIYKVQHRIVFSGQRFTDVDLFVPAWNLCIYCDGDYWHNLPEYKTRDARITTDLEKLGYQVLRLWEHEINKQATVVESKIKSYGRI